MDTHAEPVRPIAVAIAGLGAIGLPVARWLDGGIDGLKLVAVSANDKARATERLKDLRTPPPVVDIPDLVADADLIIECLPPDRFADIAEPAIEAGRILVALTPCSLLAHWHLVDRAKKTGARIIIPTGALLGFDAVRAAAKGTIHEVSMATRKPPGGLKSAKFVVEQGIDLDGLTEPLKLYEGTVRDAAAKFPANVNVAVALSLAGTGPDNTRYEIWADPAVDRNTHLIKVDADSTRFEMSIAGVPTEENPATGKLTPLSVMATLEGLVSTLRIGA